MTTIEKLYILFVVLCVVAGVLVVFFAPCKYLGFMPLKELPTRCTNLLKL